MNKIKCEIQSNIFEDFPVGTIFLHGGDFYIKINQDEIWDDLGPAEDCSFDDEVDKSTVPNAVRLSDGKAAAMMECDLHSYYKNLYPDHFVPNDHFDIDGFNAGRDIRKLNMMAKECEARYAA